MQQVVLIICDGWGYREEKKYNAIAMAKKPNFDYLWNHYPHALLKASGEDIGLPAGQIGTSEANHLIIGSGRIVYQNLMQINNAIKDKTIFKNPVLNQVFDHVKKFQSNLHLMGILGSGGVHGYSSHLEAIIAAAGQAGLKNVFLHLFTDGRDTSPKSAIQFVKDLENFLQQKKVGRIATIGGRYFGMDRDNNTDRIEKHFQTIVFGKGPAYQTAVEAINENYKKDITDEFIEPAVIFHQPIQKNDGVIFTNFRSDRAKQITRRFLSEKIPNLFFASMTKYADDFNLPVLFPPLSIVNTLSEVLSQAGYKQLRVTETEKFTHLTFFFNSQRYQPDPGEERVMIPSNKDIATHDQKPEMKAIEISDKVVEGIKSGQYQFICTNLVNADMVGHSGNLAAIIKAVETVDLAIGKIIEAANETGATVILTADHGNAEETFDEKTQQPKTAHTTNPVPFILISKEYSKINHETGFLSDIAPTILKIFQLPIPNEMTGKSFI